MGQAFVTSSSKGKSEPDLEGLAQRINDVCRSATLDLVFRVGELVIEELFERSIQLWERSGVRAGSYRALAARGDLMLSASALCRAVGVYALVERLGGRARWSHLTASHFQEALSLEGESQDALLQVAEEQHWPVARLRAEARLHRRPRDNRVAALQVGPLQRIRASLAAYQARVSRLDFGGLDNKRLQAVRQAVREVHETLVELEDLLSTGHDPQPRCASDIAELKGPRDRVAASK
jgi:hypothetical protein